MSESPYIHNVSMQNFQNLVLEKSINKPVLVDFWADWCQPCQTIMPMLAKLAEEYDGKFELAKVNADEEQELAAHFGIKSLPTMKLFYQGQIVDERMGAVPESDIRAMIDKHIVSESDQLVQAAMMAYQQGHTAQALEVLNNALAKDPDNAELKVTIAQMVYSEGDSKSAVALLDSLDERRQQTGCSNQTARRNQAGGTARRFTGPRRNRATPGPESHRSRRFVAEKPAFNRPELITTMQWNAC